MPLILIALFMGFLPAQAHAWVGPVVEVCGTGSQDGVDGDDVGTTARTAVSQDGMTIASLYNQYITFEIDAESGLRCRTVPSKSYSGTLKQSIANGTYQELEFKIKYNNKSEKTLTPSKVTPVIDREYTQGRDVYSLELLYEFKSSDVMATVRFCLVETAEGLTRGDFGFPVSLERYDAVYPLGSAHGKTYMVVAKASFYNTGTDTGNAWMNLTCNNLAKFGHESETNAKTLMASHGAIEGPTGIFAPETKTQHADLVSLTQNMGKTSVGNYKKDYYTEVCTTGYATANPFVALGYTFDHATQGYHAINGVDGNWAIDPLADFFEFNAKKNPTKFKAYGSDIHSSFSFSDYDNYENARSTQAWGFRNLYLNDETPDETAATIDSEYTDITTNAGRLAVVPVSVNADGIVTEAQVKELSAEDSVPQDAVAIYHGTFTYSSSLGTYDFEQGAAYLSQTISANFDPADGGYFRLKPDGTVLAKGVSLSMPTFCFYKSKNPSNGIEPAFSYKKGEGLIVTMKPGNNKSFIKVNIPYADTSLESATVDTQGNIVFSGEIGFGTIFQSTQFSLDQLSYGLKNKTFKLNGLKASLDVQDVNLFGLEVDTAKGEIDTFKHYYNFELAVNAFDIVSFDAALELMKTRDGTLMPNKLYGELVLEGAQGIPLVPPTPVVEINGGGIGFDNLVDTVNGDYRAIPPVKLLVTAAGKVLKIVEGNLTVTLGASGIEVAGKDLSVKDHKFIDELSMHFWAEVMDREKDGVKYTGTNLNGGLAVEAGFANEGTWKNVVTAEGSLELNAFGGTGFRAGKGQELLLLVDTTGHIDGSLKTPSSWDVIGGKTIASAGVMASVGVSTIVPITGKGNVGKTFSDALRNTNGYLGICARGSLLGLWGRAWYISPNDIGGSYHGYSKPDYKTLPSASTQNAQNTQNASSNRLMAMGLYDEGGTQVGIAVAESGLKAQDDSVVSVEDYGENGSQIAVQLPEGKSVANMAAVLEAKLPEGSGINRNNVSVLLDGLSIDGAAAKELEIDEETGEASDGSNVCVNYKVIEGDDQREDEITDEIKSVFFFLDNTKTSWTITSANSKLVCDDDSFLVSGEDAFEALKDVELASAGDDAKVLSGKAANLDENNTYEIHVYMGTDKDSGEYPVGDPIPVTLGATEFSFENVPVPLSGTAASTGEYYVSAALLMIVKEDFNGDGVISDDETAQVPLDRWSASDTITYTNPNELAAPSSVSIEAAGNEVLSCTFSEVANADGYRVRILKDGEDTGYGYEFAMQDGELTCAGNGEAVEHVGTSYTVRLAPTVGGQATDKDGNVLDEKDQPQLLKPGSGYKLAVSAYRIVEPPSDQEIVEELSKATYRDFSAETLSNEAEIPEYTPAEFTVKMNDKALAADAESSMFEAVVSPQNKELEIEVTSEGAYEIDVARQAMDDVEPDMLHADGSSLIGSLGELFGSATYEIVITKTDGVARDKTRAFLQVSVDDVPPTLLMDADLFEAGADGGFTISGTTDPDIVVSATDSTLVTNGGKPAGADGRFTLSGVVTDRYYTLTTEKISFAYKYNGEQYTDTYENETDFIDMLDYFTGELEGGRLDSFEVSPATWSGAVEYTISLEYPEQSMSINYSEDDFQALLAAQQNGGTFNHNGSDLPNIKNVEKYSVEEEIDEEKYEADHEYASPYETYTVGERTATGIKTLVVTAVDECGNEAQANVLIAVHNHKLAKVPEVPATCAKKGTKAYYKCTDAACGAEFLDEQGETPLEDRSALETPVDPTKHAWGAWKVTKQATEQAQGQEARTCSQCGKTETRTTPMLPSVKLHVGNVYVDGTTVPLKTKQKLAKIVAELGSGDSLASATSSNPSIVTVSIKGNKVVLAAGKKASKATATITVKSKAGATSAFKVKVQKKKVVAKKIVGFKKKVTLAKGKSFKISKALIPVSTPDKVRFKSSNKKIASVNAAGVVKAKNKGKATITVTVGKKKFKCKVTVK